MSTVEHSCNGTVRGAATCDGCLSRRTIEAPPPSHFGHMPRRKTKTDSRYDAGLQPYTDVPGRDHDGLKEKKM